MSELAGKMAFCPECGTPYDVSETESKRKYVVRVKCSFCDKTTRVQYPNKAYMLKEVLK